MSAPPPPQPADPNQVAANQQNINTQSGVESQAGSMVNQNTPWGSVSYQQTGTGPGGVPIYTATTALDPTIANIFNTSKTGAANLLASANYGGAPQPGTGGGSPSQNLGPGYMGAPQTVPGVPATGAGGSPTQAIGNMTSGLTSQMLGTETSYLSPYFTQQTSQLDAQLRNQGLAPGNPAYDQSMNALQQSQNSTVTGFLAQAQPQAFSEASALYNEPAQLASALMGEVSPATVGTSTAATSPLAIQPANLIGATATAEQMQQKTYEDQLAQQQAAWSGIFGIPSAVLGGWARGGFSGLGSLFGGGAAAAGGGAAADAGGAAMAGGGSAIADALPFLALA